MEVPILVDDRLCQCLTLWRLALVVSNARCSGERNWLRFLHSQLARFCCDLLLRGSLINFLVDERVRLFRRDSECAQDFPAIRSGSKSVQLCPRGLEGAKLVSGRTRSEEHTS